MKLSRRDFLRATSLLAGGLGMAGLPGVFQRRLLAQGIPSNKKLLFIFQTGGNDGINTVIPRGDADYSVDNRPSLFLPESLAIDSGNGFAQFHPRLQPMMEIYNNSGLNGQDGPGNLAVLHRIGYAGQSRSHFDSQQFWQNGVPGDPRLEEGMFYRYLEESQALGADDGSLVAAAISSSQILALKGDAPVPNFSRASQFNVIGSRTRAGKFLGYGPSHAGGGDGEGLLGLYGLSPDSVSRPYRSLVHRTGDALGATINTLQAAVQQGAYTPENGAVYPDGSLGTKLQEAAMLFKRTPVRIVGMNVGGWDTHTGQGQVNGSHGDLLETLAQGFQAIYRDLQSQWDDLLIVTMTEFGRTSIENGSGGTDHAESGVMFVAGGGVKGGVYNCDASTWAPGDMFSANERYLARRTDFRAVFGEIFQRYFGDVPSSLDRIIPGYDLAAAENPANFVQLGFLNG
jgi:uncharacterized protein (DUF1501 family)